MPDACANFRASKPVTLGRGGGGITLFCQVNWDTERFINETAAYTATVAVARLLSIVPALDCSKISRDRAEAQDQDGCMPRPDRLGASESPLSYVLRELHGTNITLSSSHSHCTS